MGSIFEARRAGPWAAARTTANRINAGGCRWDLNTRFRRVQGTERGGAAELCGHVDINYAGGCGSFRMELDYYDYVPPLVAEKILATAKQSLHDDEE